MSTPQTLPLKRRKSLFTHFVFWFFGTLLGLAIILPIAALIFFNPNDYKPQINALLSEKTGIPIDIQGDIELKLFPWIGLKIENTALEQAPEFGKGKFLRVKEIALQFPVRELLRGHLQIETLKLKGLSVYIIKKPNGKMNIDHFTAEVEKSKKEQPAAASTDSATTSKTSKLTFDIANIDIQDAKLHYEDQSKNQTIVLSNLQFKVNNPKHLEAFPIKTQFDFVYQPKANALTGHADMSGLISAIKDNISAKLNTEFNLKQADSLWKHAKVKAVIDGHLAKIIHVNDIDIKTLNTEITGKCRIPMDEKKPVTFQFNIDALNVDALSSATTASSSKALPKSALASKSSIATEQTESKSLSRQVKGDIFIGQLHAKNLTLQRVKIALFSEKGQIHLNPLVADLYDGKLSMQVKHSLLAPSTSFGGKLTDIQLQPLLQDLGHQVPLQGRADFDFNLMQTTKIPEGNIKCHIKNGIITGVDIKYYLNKVQSMIKKEKMTLPDTKETPFTSLTATLFTHDNSIDNNDLLILSPDFRVNGVGSVDLSTDTLAYKLQAWRQYPDGTQHPNAYPLAIRLRGSLQHPKVEPDFDLYLKAVFEKEMKERLNLNKHLEKGIDKLLGGQKSNPKESDPSSEPPTLSPEEKIKEKLGKEVDKGLKKLFKVH